MRRFLTPNTGRKGRIVRGLMGLALLASAVVWFGESPWFGALPAASGLFGLFEAQRGWCLARACGLRTRF